ncbi:MAG: hypothetical protein WC635_17785 [Bacteriovorax sp.]|jgi:hypothetical protein
MSKLLISLLLLTGCLSSFAQAAAVHRGGAELLNPKAYAIEAQASVFSTTAYFDDSGTELEMNPESSFRLIDTDFKISYGVSSNLEASVFAKVRSVSSSDGTNSAANTGPESLGVEGKYSFEPINKIKYALGLRYRKTLYTNTEYAPAQNRPVDEVILGDDGSEYGIDFYATFLARPWKLDFKMGYNSPPNDLSSEIVYKLEAMYQFTKFGLFAGLDGIKSLNRDQYTDTPLSKPILNTGQTRLFNSLNREMTAPYLGFNYNFDKFLFFLKGQTVMSGISTDKGNLVLAGISWNSVGVTAESVKIDSFKEYHIDGSVLKVSARGNFIKIDQGLSTDVEKGMKFDIYQTDYFGGNLLVASGIVYEIGSDWAVIKLSKKYQEIQIKPGFAARGF